jgi:pimeloyl-ACP methyl ester carboxylesterase
MTAARQLVKRQPEHKVLLIDLRGHGNNATIAGPHTVAAAARDVAATVAHACGPDAPTPSEPTALMEDGTAPLVLGHSFGGKVGLAYAAARAEPPIRTWLFDSNPTITTGAGGVGDVLAILEDAARDKAYASKKAAVAALVKRGLEPATAQWLAMTTETVGDGVRFSYDLDAVRALFDDHCQADLLPEARALDDADRLGLVIAGKADVVPRDLGLKHTYLFEESGHNVHVDALPELLDVVVGTHGADWV